LKKRPEHYALFGIYCWHAYPTNPKLIELQYSKDMLNYNTLAKFDILQKPGIQIFNFDKIKSENVKLLKIVIKESHGGSRTYLNNVFLLDDMQIEESDSMIVLDSRESNMPRKSEISTERKEKIKDEKELDTNFNTKLNTIENISKEKIINSYNPLVISDIQTNLSINKNETKNPLFISETNYLISDSDLSIRGEKLNMSHMSDLNKRNPIREALSDEENEEDIYEYQTHIQKPSYTGTNLSKINSSRENLEDKLMKGLNIRQEHVLDLNPLSENTEITGNPGNTRNKKETDFKAGNNLNILENYKNKIKRLNQNYSLDSNLVEMSLTNNNHNNRRSLEIKKEESSNFTPTYNKLQNSQYSKSKDNFNYKSLESQLREMQCELNKLNYNTERLDSFRDLINKSKEDLFLKEENVKNDFENIEKINFISPPMSPSNIIKSEVKNNRQVEENPFDNYLVHNDSPLLDTKVTNLQNDVDSLKSQISKISENIDTLVSTKNLMTANNMQFILDQCRNMIHSPKFQMKTGDEDRNNFVNHGGLPLYPNGCTIPHSCCNNSHHAISSQNLSSGLHNRNFSSVPQVECYNENLNKENSKIQITSDGNRKRLKFEKSIIVFYI
jgi:hypothetical protein